jgi:hypothetical protein
MAGAGTILPGNGVMIQAGLLVFSGLCLLGAVLVAGWMRRERQATRGAAAGMAALAAEVGELRAQQERADIKQKAITRGVAVAMEEAHIPVPAGMVITAPQPSLRLVHSGNGAQAS